jgi:hypothetical protein
MSAVIVALSSNWQASTPEDTLGDGADTDADAVALGFAEDAFGVGDAASGLPEVEQPASRPSVNPPAITRDTMVFSRLRGIALNSNRG